MEVIPLIRNSATGSEASKGDNGIKRHVQEWSRLDRLTGILEHARVEADQWTNHTANTKHKYGKVVDRRARNLADGSKEETQQTKQLEVFQAHTAGCSVQVIRSQTSTTSSWHNSSAGSNAFQWPSSIFDKKDNQFDQLRLEHSPLDVSSQKSKATVGRSGSISTRRPPTRRPQAVTSQLPKIESIDSTDTMETSSSLNENIEESVSTNLNRLKSCSNDEIRSDINESEEPLDRSSRFRRSLQFAQSKNIESNHKVAGELENVLKKVLGKKLQAVDGDIVDEYSLIKPASPLKKPTFITVESLKKTKNNLRHLNEDKDKDDDGIETDVKPPGDSRSLDYRGSALTRTEEWYNRRKSYGFEKVTTSDHNGKYATDPSAMDSSTDSGICRSTENGLSNSSRQSSVDRESIADLVKKYSNKEINNNTQVHAYNTTVVAKGKILEAINSLRSKSSAYFDVVKPSDTISESTENDESEKEQVYMRRLSVGMDMVMDKNVNRDEVPKRHSIAVVSEVADKEPGIDKKNGNKKVEFCRTEVHFDATPGKINIVDMEDKPAPAQLYRPKKRYNRPPEKSSHGLPEYRFGDDVHSDVVLQINGTGNQNGGNNGNECPTTEDETTDNGSSMPKSILKRQQLQHQQQSQHQQQQQNTSDNSSGVASDNGIEVRISSTESTPVDCRRASWSVADRVKQVEAVGFSTRVNFTEGETTAVGFDPADPRKQRYSYNGSASPVWYQNNGNSPSATADTSAKCHEKLLVRIGGGACNGKPNGASAAADLCAFSRCFSDQTAGNHLPLSSASLVMNTKFRTTEQPSTYLEEMNTKVLGRFQKAVSTSWPRYGHKTYPTPATRKHNVLKSCADIKRDRAAKGMPDVIGALDDLSKSIDAQIVDRTSDRHHVTLIKVRQPCDEIHGRLEYAKDLMSTDETSEESLKADEEVRSYMAADCVHEDDQLPECKNLKKLISTVKKNITQSQCSQDNRLKKTDVKTYESTLVVPNVTSVLLNHEKQLEPERSQFQPVSVHTSQVTHVVKHQFDDSLQKQPSKRVPVKIVQDNRKCKPKTDAPVTKMCATVSLKQVPMTVQPKPVQCNENKKKSTEKKESIYGNIGYRANSLRVKDKPATNKQAQALFSTGRDSWLNMPKDLGPKLNKSKATTYKSRVNRKETVDSEISVLEELNRAADEILKAVNGYTDDESQLPNDAEDNKTKTNLDHSEAKLKNKKKAARLLQRANSREALLHLDEVSSSDEDAADEVQRIKPKMQRKTKTQSQTTNNSVATKTTASFAKKIQSRTQNVTKTNLQHKVHPTYYGNVSSCTQAPMKFRNKPSESLAKQIVVDQKDTKGRYQCKITARTFNSKKLKGSVEENKNSIKGC